MPSWVHNRIRCHRDNWPALKDAILDPYEEGVTREVDFALIVPVPEHVNRDSKDWWDDPNGWHQWSYRNWGTSRNAVDTIIDDKHCEISFGTAWKYPEPFMLALGRTLGFPIHVAYAEESVYDFGAIGAYRIVGDQVDDHLPERFGHDQEHRNVASHIHSDKPYAQEYAAGLTREERGLWALSETYDVWEYLGLTFDEDETAA